MAPDDEPSVSTLSLLYVESLPHVYGYLARRCDRSTAEDLTADTFLAAVTAQQRGDQVSIPWLMGTARHKLVDHWRRLGRSAQAMEALWSDTDPPADSGDPIDTIHVETILDRLRPHHRLALVLRYVDGLAVPDVAALLERSVHATESLLVRAKAAYRQAMTDIEGGDE